MMNTLKEDDKQLIPLLDINMMSNERHKEIVAERKKAHPEMYTPERLEEYRKAAETTPCNIPGIRNVPMNK